MRNVRPKSAADFIPPRPTLKSAREASKDCRGCDLWKRGTQTVFGEGPRQATLMLVGEQPGDAEDLSGHPFVGPAGKLLDRALADAGIDRAAVYVTNVVKHFKWEPRGKRRIHKKPRASEIAACRPWLDTEIALVKPRVIVCLGATAAQALLGPPVQGDRSIAARSCRRRSRRACWRPCILRRFCARRTRRRGARRLKRFTDDLRAAARALSSE